MIKAEGSNSQTGPLMALCSMACSIVATGWIRDFGEGTLSAPLIAWLLCVFGIGLLVALASRTMGVPGYIQLLIMPLSWFPGLMLAAQWVGQCGAYAVPRIPDSVGLAFCIAGMVTGLLSLRKKERAKLLAATGLSPGSFVAITAFFYDPLTQSPYFVLRQFAAAAYNNDQKAMMPFFSSASRRDFSQLPTTQYGNGDGVFQRQLKTVGPLHGNATRNTLLLNLKIVGNRATIDCPVPERWNLFRIAGHMGEMYLIREGQHWKVDAVRYCQESTRRRERAMSPPQATPSQTR